MALGCNDNDEGTIKINCVAEGSNTVKSCNYKITGSTTRSGTLYRFNTIGMTENILVEPSSFTLNGGDTINVTIIYNVPTD